MPRWLGLVLAIGGGVAAALVPAEGQTPKRGGIPQHSLLTEDPPGFSSTSRPPSPTSGRWSPCYSNLVLFDPLKPLRRADTVIPELAERWSWQDNYRNLVFFLRKNVHVARRQAVHRRGTSSTRSTSSARRRTRRPSSASSPRKDWYANVEAIETPEPHTVIFRLKRPQPSLLLMLASGYSPVYPAHVPLAELRQRCVGTGPFRLKEYVRGQLVELERNPDYFVPDRPYLDGIRYTDHPASGAPAWPRSRPGASTPSCRSR